MTRPVLLGLLLCLGLAPLAAGQDRVPEDGGRVYWEGIDGFLLLLVQRGVEFDATDIDWTTRDPSEQLIVILGETGAIGHRQSFADGALERFVHRGGALLFASDLGDEGGVLEGFHVAFGPAPVLVGDPDDQLTDRTGQRYADCPLVRDATPSHPLFVGALPLATNQPAYIRSEPELPRLKIVAAFGPTSRPVRRAIFAVEGLPRPGRGKAVVLADHSLFINVMITRAGNPRFAANLLDHLLDEGRRHVLVLYNGIRVTPLTAAIPAPIPRRARRPAKGRIVAVLNEFLVWLEDQGIVQEVVAEASSLSPSAFDALSSAFVTLVTPIAILLLLGLGLRAGGRPSSSDRPRRPVPGPAAGAREARLAAVVATGRHAEPMILRARQFVARTGLGHPIPRPIRTPGGTSRRRARRDLDRLVRAAGGRLPRRRDRAAFERLAALAATYETMIENGSLTLDGKS